MRALRHPFIFIYKHCKYAATIIGIVHPAGSWLLSRMMFILFVVVLAAAAIPSMISGFTSIGDLAAVISAGFAVCMFLQVIQERISNQNSMTTELLKDDSSKREEMKAAQDSLELLKIRIASEDNSNKSFREIYADESFKDIRQYAFHYEYMGQLVYRRQVNFSVLFDTVTFPKMLEDLWVEYDNDQQTKNPTGNGLIAKAREDVPDEWAGIEYLYRIYMVKRTFNRYTADKYNLVSADKIDRDRIQYKRRKEKFRNLYLQMPL